MKRISYFNIYITTFLISLNTISFSQTDTFGIKQMYNSKAGFLEWNSTHWNNGKNRTFKYASDPYDPTDWTEDHSATSPGFYIDGAGIMTMSGSPRFHINPLRNNKVNAQTFTDIEFTAYYRKKGNNGANYGGMIVGMRGSSLGHGSSGGNECDAMCYQARFRNDGKWDFEKELKHSGTSYYSGSGFNKQDPLWSGAKLPANKWIGMKYILINENNNTTVRLRVFIDSTSNGNPINGGDWQLVGDISDIGTNWKGADISGCSYTDPFMPILAGGNIYMRTDNDTAQYKMVSIREIDPTSSVTSISKNTNQTNDLILHLLDNNRQLKIELNNTILKTEIISCNGQIYTPNFNENYTIDISKLAYGCYVLKIQTQNGLLSQKFIK